MNLYQVKFNKKKTKKQLLRYEFFETLNYYNKPSELEYQTRISIMKPKHKQLPATYSQDQALPQYNSCKIITKKPSLISHNHLPISYNYTISLKKQAKNDYVYQSCSKEISKQIKSSPYANLPSIPRDENNENVNCSNVSDRCYENNKLCERGSAGSIYQQFRFDQREKRPFETEESQVSSYYCGDQNKDYNHRLKGNNYHIETKRKQPAQNYTSNQQPSSHTFQQSKSQSRCNHKSPNFTKKTQQNPNQKYSVNPPTLSNQPQLQTLNKSQQLIKKHINQKLDRVCEKIGNLSREKDREHSNSRQGYIQGEYRSEQGASVRWQNNNNHDNSSHNVGLCYSSIVYNNRNDYLAHTPKSVAKNSHQYQQNHLRNQQKQPQIKQPQIYQDNLIQHRILSPPKPTHQQFLQSRIIEMDKKIVFANAKIIKLQEQLLRQKQQLIKKQKQWLLRENQLLNWIQENQVEGQFVEFRDSPKRKNNSLNQSHIVTANNIVLDDLKNQQYQVAVAQLHKYKQLSQGLSQLINEMIKVFKINDNWLTLMNRTLSHQLPGTAFRVKEQMNLNHKLFNQLQSICQNNIYQLTKLQQKSITQQPPIRPDLSNISPSQSPFINNPSLSQSQVFLLESYCPPVSQQFQIQTTKRNTSSIKPCDKQRKSISCLSESKSVTSTNKKYPSISTHNKSVKKQSKTIEPSKPHQKPNHTLYHSRKSQYYCDQVFYSRAKEINSHSPEQNQAKILLSSQQADNQLYYLLSLQAFTIETLIPQHSSAQSTLDQDHEENLLSGMDS